ncbi:MAG: class I SAM-dependent methyltransferase [Sulfurifustis sp.]
MAEALANARENSTVIVTCDSPSTRVAAEALAARLALPFDASGNAETLLRLVQTARGLELHDPATGAHLHVEFKDADIRAFRSGGRGPNLLRRAIGPLSGGIVDASAGLGRDAVHLACLGYPVTAIERNPIVSALAQDALARARAHTSLPSQYPIWLTGDARRLLPTLDPRPAVVYLDPMFPPKRKKSAATRKEMHLLQRLVGADSDAADLLALARACALERVVVKRADDAPPLAPGSSHAFTGKLVRYDVYDAGHRL